MEANERDRLPTMEMEKPKLGSSDPGLGEAERTLPQIYSPEAPPPGRGTRTLLALLVLVLLAAVGALFALYQEAQSKERTAERGRESSLAEAAREADLRKGLELRVSALEEEKKSLAAHAVALSDDLQQKEAALEELRGTYDSLHEKMKAEIKQGEVNLLNEGDRIQVDLVDKVLFDSGAAELSPRGKEVLARLGSVLAKVKNRRIQVSGHTDDAPIATEQLRAKYPTNWELSVARAVNVVRHLTDRCGVPPGRLVAAGHAHYQPVSSNSSASGRARNRRIEILLMPDLSSRGAGPASTSRPPPKKPGKR